LGDFSDEVYFSLNATTEKYETLLRIDYASIIAFMVVIIRYGLRLYLCGLFKCSYNTYLAAKTILRDAVLLHDQGCICLRKLDNIISINSVMYKSGSGKHLCSELAPYSDRAVRRL